MDPAPDRPLDSSPPASDDPVAPLAPDPVGRDVILVDGVRIFCNRLVALIGRRDRRGRFLFAHIQTPLARTVLARLLS